jgi:nudix-type nucleoside diphosphatase (YffH/AdpP family)
MTVIKSVRTIHEGWGRFLMAALQLPNGEIVQREIEDHGDAVAVLVYNSTTGTALLVKQTRVPLLLLQEDPELLEIPAGRADHGSLDQSVRAEALEEVGVILKSVGEPIVLMAMASVSTERVHLYLAEYSDEDRVHSGGGVASENEAITVVEKSLKNLAAMADAGELRDMKTVIAVNLLRSRRPSLFT